jgi:hypothetical protein
MRIRIPDDKPRYFTGTPAEIVDKLAAQPLAGFLGHMNAADYMAKISEIVREFDSAAPRIRSDTPDHFLLDAHVVGWLIIQTYDEPMDPGVVE